MNITAIILTLNEEKNIKHCIESILELVDRIVIVDSGSEDNTVEIAKEYGAEVYFNKYIHYANQFNWALNNTKINTEWVLRIDADERIPEALRAEIAENIIKYSENTIINGFVFRLKVQFLGRYIKHGGVYPFRKMMLFRKSKGYIENRRKDAHTVLKTGKTIELKNDALHYDFKDLHFWINKHNWGATNEMLDYVKEDNANDVHLNNKDIKSRRKAKRLYYKFPLFFRAHLLFCYRYFIRLGFLDGKEGLIFHFLQSYWYRFLIDAKIYEYNIMIKSGERYIDPGKNNEK